MTINALVAALPELYQPIYGFAEFDTRAARPCADRFARVAAAYRALSTIEQRPLRVLDIGSAQGYFSFRLGELGAEVTALDRCPQNIDLCKALALQFPDYRIDFLEASVEDYLTEIEPGKFDLVLGLSIVHHLCAERGIESAETLVRRIAENTGAGIFELALATEPASWASRQPASADQLLQGYAFLNCMEHFPTHLSDTRRPMHFASNRYWFLGERVGAFSSWSETAHDLDDPAIHRERRYYENSREILKLFRFRGSHADLNRAELANEVRLLQRTDLESLALPRLIDHDVDAECGWLLRERIPGCLLSRCILEARALQPMSILGELLQQLARLESVGLFHEDLRAWNILIREDGKPQLLDFGSLGSKNVDREFPQDWRIPLLILLEHLYHPDSVRSWPLHPTQLLPTGFPPPVADWVRQFWRDAPHEWSWQRLAKCWVERPAQSQTSNDNSLEEAIWEMAKNETLATERQAHGLQARLILTLFGKPPAPTPTRDRSQAKLSVCPVCLTGIPHEDQPKNWRGFPEHRLMRCDHCGCWHTDPMPHDELLNRIYSDLFDYRWYRDHYPAKLRDARARIREFGPLLGRRVLDFGGGAGYFSAAAREAGLESVSFDPYLQNSDEPATAEAWDSVVALHVLEHSNDPSSLLRQMGRLLSDSGTLIIAVPNAEGLGYRELGMAWVWAQPPFVHIFHFTTRGLKALLENEGFELMEIRYHDRWDANWYADILTVKRQRYLDSLWGLRYFNRYGTYRRAVARITSWFRWRFLAIAERNTKLVDIDRAEILVVARKRAT